MRKYEWQDTSNCPKCKNGEALQEHTCPYRVEIYDSETLCRCCSNCRAECAEEV